MKLLLALLIGQAFGAQQVQTNTKTCLAGWTTNMKDTCQLYSELTTCQAQLGGGGGGGAAHPAVIMHSGQMYPYHTYTPDSAFADLEAKVIAHFNWHNAHTLAFTYDDGQGNVYTVTDDTSLGTAFAFQKSYGFRLVMDAQRVTVGPTTSPTTVPTPRPTNAPVVDPLAGLAGGGWRLALNINTRDGHNVDYTNFDFWETPDKLGGATDDHNNYYVKDFKDPSVYGQFKAKYIMAVVHVDGVVQGHRVWELNLAAGANDGCGDPNGCELYKYFISANGVCNGDGVNPAQGGGSISGDTFYRKMTTQTIEASTDIGSIDRKDPIAYNAENLYTNVDSGVDGDYNRLSAMNNPRRSGHGQNNVGWGLGTMYDIGCCHGSRCDVPPTTVRPAVDGTCRYMSWGIIGTDNNNISGRNAPCCNNYGGCPDMDYAIFVSNMKPQTPSPTQPVPFDQLSGGGWQVAMSINTRDGHNVDYTNFEFWESPTLVGGASQNAAEMYQKDYKDPAVYGSFKAKEIMVVVHVDGTQLGYRVWDLNLAAGANAGCGDPNGCELYKYFISANGVCNGDGTNPAAGGGSISGNTFYRQMTTATTDANQGAIDQKDPIAYDPDMLYTNVDSGADGDYNRLSNMANPSYSSHRQNNMGWGLGTMYDIGCCHGNRCDNPPSTVRPAVDGVCRYVSTWGIIGTDNNNVAGRNGPCCNNYNGCPDMDYVILVR